MMRRGAAAAAVLVVVGILSTGCVLARRDGQRAAHRMPTPDPAESMPFPLVKRSAAMFEEPERQAAFLAEYAQRHPEDPNNGYYVLLAAKLYREMGNTPMATMYYRLSLLHHPNIVNGRDETHRTALLSLIDTDGDPDNRVRYFEELLDRYSESVDRAATKLAYARALERAGRWEDAYDAYRDLLRTDGVATLLRPEAIDRIRADLAFYDSSHDWTDPNLEGLVQNIKNALWAQNPALLYRYRAEQNFFTMSWEQEQSDENSQIQSFDIGSFLVRSRVRFADDLDLASNAREAYLRTWGWSHRIPTWYLYFRRVEFPADPDINGNWEWAGIYFGEAL